MAFPSQMILLVNPAQEPFGRKMGGRRDAGKASPRRPTLRAEFADGIIYGSGPVDRSPRKVGVAKPRRSAVPDHDRTAASSPGVDRMRRAYLSVLSTALLATVWMASWGAPPAVAQVRRVEILGREAPALGGRSFGDVGLYEKIEGRIQRGGRSGRPAEPDDHRPGTGPPQRRRQGRVRGRLRPPEADGHGPGQRHPPLRRPEPRRGGHRRRPLLPRPGRGVPLGRLAGGRAPGAGPARPRRAGGAEPGRIADHRHGPRRVRRPARRPARRDAAAGQRLQPRPGPLSPGATRRPDGGPDPAPQRGRPPALHPPGRLGVRRERLRRQPLPGEARPRQGLAPGRLRAGVPLRAGLHGEGPEGHGAGPCGGPRHGRLLPPRGRGRGGPPQPARVPHPVRDGHRRLAVGELPEDLRAPGLQRGHRRASRVRRPLPDRRGAADEPQRPLRRRPGAGAACAPSTGRSARARSADSPPITETRSAAMSAASSGAARRRGRPRRPSSPSAARSCGCSRAPRP